MQIQPGDGLPDRLCKECTEKAYICYNFKVTIENSDATLRSVLFKDHSDVKKNVTTFEGNNTTGYLMGIKTEIAFVDADPFIDDDGDFDETLDYAENSSTPNQQNDSYNNNSYQQDTVDDEDDDAGDPESEDYESDENFDMKPPKDKTKKKLNQPMSPRIVENVDYVKDEEGKYVCKICNKKLVDKKGLNLHVRLHTGENLKRCNICNRGRNFSKSLVIIVNQI